MGHVPSGCRRWFSISSCSFVACKKFCLFVISPSFCSAIHLLKPVNYVTYCFPLSLYLLCEYQIFQALLPHYVTQKFQLPLPDVFSMHRLHLY